MRIMYVEDNQANAFLIKRIAGAGNHEFYHYIDAESALNNLKQDSPEVIFVDIQLAGEMDGLQFVRTARRMGYTTPMIAITAFANQDDRDLYINAGCNEFIIKPASPEYLVDLLAAL